jgi:hypothetical protein
VLNKGGLVLMWQKNRTSLQDIGTQSDGSPGSINDRWRAHISDNLADRPE